MAQGKEQVCHKEMQGSVRYVDFWASWCFPCQLSFPWMNRMHQKFYGKGLRILAINLDADRKKANTFLKRFPAKFKVKYDPQGELAKKYVVKGMPHSFLLDRRGCVLFSHIGFRKRDEALLREKIKAALKK